MRFGALPTTKPSSVAYFSSSHLHRRINAAAEKTSFDAVLVHCTFAAQYAQAIPAKFRLMDFGDLDSGKWLDYSQRRAFPLSSAYGIESRKLRRYEKHIAASFDYCTLTTQGEFEDFKRLGVECPHAVIPNGVDGDYFQPNGRPVPETPVIVFLGRMDYFPNIDGVLYFTKEILPKIRARIPKVEFRIVGSNPTREVQNLTRIPNVHVTGHVADVRPFLTGATLTVAPLRIARGTQNKILESMAAGLPVVATPEAAKGIQAVPNEHLLVGSNPNLFSEQVIRILESTSLRDHLSIAGRERVRQVHTWTSSMLVLEHILDKYTDRCAKPS